MNNSVIFSVTLALLSCLMSATARAQDIQIPPGSQDFQEPIGAQGDQASSNINQGPGMTSDIQDPVVQLQLIRQKREQPTTPGYSLFRTSPLTPLRKRGIQAEKRIYEATSIKFGTNFNTLLQGLGDAIPGEDTYGMATFMSLIGTWDGFRKGCPNQGEITLGLDGR